MNTTLTRLFASEEELASFVAQFASGVKNGGIIFLSGELGVGKTTFVRLLLKALGYKGKVKSPTYTLVEPYEIDDLQIYHFDFYRITNPEELIYIGIHDYFQSKNLCCIEWPEKGLSVLPLADLYAHFSFKALAREIHLTAETPHGAEILANIK